MASPSYTCSDCAHESHQWFGRCPSCGSWSTATTLSPDPGRSAVAVVSLAQARSEAVRLPTGLGEVDRVLGGGFVAGEVALLAGEPGIGKSTLVLQIIDAFLRDGRSALLVTGEESPAQVALRGRRVGVDLDRFRAAATASLPDVVATTRAHRPELLVVDSVQTLTDPSCDAAAGSVAQVRACAAALIEHAKHHGTVVLVVGHVTKEGGVAGPKTLEHAVDAVLMLDGERSGSMRLLRAVKNRFGSCEETGVFVMDECGLRAVADPSAMLLSDRRPGISGSTVFPSLEGTRPVLVEVQALVSTSTGHHPRRVAIGIDARRTELLIGVLGQHAGLKFGDDDVFVAAAGGLSVRETGADLAVCTALRSARRELPVDPCMVALGEVGLSGEVRRVPRTDRRLTEAKRLGFRRALVPPGTDRVPGIDVIEVADLAQAIAALDRPAMKAAG